MEEKKNTSTGKIKLKKQIPADVDRKKMRQLEDYFLEERSNRVAQPAKSSQKSENGWNSEPIEKPRFPRGTLFGAVDSLLDFLAGQFPIVGSTRFQIAQ